jgi:acyl-coenzyme A synthetase/AMP-(fatty) acid ligase
MDRPAMDRYEDAYRAFRWELPATFNFGVDVVDAWARTEPSRPALVWCDATGAERRFTFADMADLSSRFANVLAGHGIEKGDRVLVMLPRIPEWQIATVGCLKLGAVPIPCIGMLTAKDVAYRAAHSGARAAVTTEDNAVKFDGLPLDARLVVGKAPGWAPLRDALGEASGRFDAATVALEDPAIMYYTSGSAGPPKGVLHAARALFAWRVSAWFWNDLDPDDTMWCTADTGWSKAGTSILFGPWSCGACVLFYDGPFDAHRRFELLARYRVSVFCAAATELRRLVQVDASAHDLSALRLTLSAGEAVNPEIVERWHALAGVPLLDGYGQTETLMTVLNYRAMPVKLGSMGRPLPGTEIAILDPDGRPTTVETPGEIAIRLPNPQFMLGYWQEPDLTAAAILRVAGVEYFLTGDMATRDEDGYLYYQGRADDVISSAGYRIGPLEVENALIEHPAVQECAAVASPDPERGEIVKAFVVLAPGASASDGLIAELQDHAKRTTAPYKYPRRMEFVDDLPKTASGKIRRRVLRDREFEASKD